MRRPAPRKGPMRWHVPPAILHDERETLEGTSILDEFRSPVGVYLWERWRDVTLWSAAARADRGGLFAEAAPGAEPAAPPDLPPAVSVTFGRLVREPTAVSADEVAGAAEKVAAWARQHRAPATALAFTQAAALATPEEPERALATGRLAAAAGQDARAEAWFRRALGLGRRAGDWATYAFAYIGLGALREQRGESGPAHAFYERAWRASHRHGSRKGRGAAAHGMMRAALREGRMDDAERLGGRALTYLGEHPGLRHDLAELAVLQGRGAEAVPVLQELLDSRSGLSQRVHTLCLLCRAAAQAGERDTLEIVWPAVEELVRAAGQGAGAGGALLDLARAVAATGAVHRAAFIVRAVQDTAVSQEDRDAAAALLRMLGS